MFANYTSDTGLYLEYTKNSYNSIIKRLKTQLETGKRAKQIISPRKDTYMDNKYMKKYLTSLVNREAQIKTTGMVNIKKSDNKY